MGLKFRRRPIIGCWFLTTCRIWEQKCLWLSK